VPAAGRGSGDGARICERRSVTWLHGGAGPSFLAGRFAPGAGDCGPGTAAGRSIVHGDRRDAGGLCVLSGTDGGVGVDYAFERDGEESGPGDRRVWTVAAGCLEGERGGGVAGAGAADRSRRAVWGGHGGGG